MIANKRLTVLDTADEIQWAGSRGYWFYWVGRDTKPHFEVCRELFQWYAVEASNANSRYQASHDCKCIGLACGKNNNFSVDVVHKLWKRLEHLLGISQSKFYRIITDTRNPTWHSGGINAYDNGFIININPWWIANTTRRSAMTLFIRGFTYYAQALHDRNRPLTSRGIWTFLKYYALARRCPLALRAFAGGRTVPTFSDIWLWNSSGTKKGFVAKFE